MTHENDPKYTRKLTRWERFLKATFNRLDRYIQRVSDRRWDKHQRKYN